MTTVNDLVLIYLQDKPLSFARIEAIEPNHKRGWYHVRFLLLQIPLQVVTWILRDAYINGDSFTMDGNPMRIEKVEPPRDAVEHPEDPGGSEDMEDSQPTQPDATQPKPKSGKVISLVDLKKR